MEVKDPLQEALQKQFAGEKFVITDDPNLPKNEFGTIAEDKPAETTPATTPDKPEVKAEEVKPEVKAPETESSLKPEVKPEPKIETPPVKTFEQLLEERSEGKYKNWDDVNNIIKQNPYADDKVKLINDYVKAGGTLEDYLETQTQNFDTMSPREVMEYSILRENPDLTDEEVEYELEKRYAVDKWKTNPEDYEGGIEPKEVRIAKIKYNRETEQARTELKAFQKEWAIPQKKEVEQPKAVDPKIQEQWNKDVKTAVDALQKVPLKISDTETFDYVVEEAERTELTKIANELFTDTGKFWNQFKTPEGKFDVKALSEAMFKIRNFEKAIMLASNQARTKGAEKVIKEEIKNVEFKPEAKSTADKPKSMGDQIAEQFIKQHG